MAKQLARELINAGVHFGHGVSRWNPKMAPYIFAKRNHSHHRRPGKHSKAYWWPRLLAETVASGGKRRLRRDEATSQSRRSRRQAMWDALRVRAMARRNADQFPHDRSRLQRLEQLEAMEQGRLVGGRKQAGLASQAGDKDSHQPRRCAKDVASCQGRWWSSTPRRVPGACAGGQLGIPTAGVLDTDSDPDTVDVAILPTMTRSASRSS